MGDIRHCGLEESTRTWDGTGCEIESWLIQKIVFKKREHRFSWFLQAQSWFLQTAALRFSYTEHSNIQVENGYNNVQTLIYYVFQVESVSANSKFIDAPNQTTTNRLFTYC